MSIPLPIRENARNHERRAEVGEEVIFVPIFPSLVLRLRFGDAASIQTRFAENPAAESPFDSNDGSGKGIGGNLGSQAERSFQAHSFSGRSQVLRVPENDVSV